MAYPSHTKLLLVDFSFWAGALLIAACEVLLWWDVQHRGAAVPPAFARWVAVHMTPLCWAGYLLVFDGMLKCRHGSPARARPRRFVLCLVTSVAVWSFFDWINFSFIHAWSYHGLSEISLADVLISKFTAFAAISPAMFLAAALYQDLGLRRLRARPVRIGRAWQVAMLSAGIALFVAPFLLRDPVGCVPLWVCLVLLLDPINHWIGRPDRTPSLIGDWQAGRLGRTVALAAAGLTCGFLWEFWNYWAAAKWTYDLPFLGPLEGFRLFEMPLPGYAGFLPFALECWVAFHFILAVMERLGLRLAEPLPDDEIL